MERYRDSYERRTIRFMFRFVRSVLDEMQDAGRTKSSQLCDLWVESGHTQKTWGSGAPHKPDQPPCSCAQMSGSASQPGLAPDAE
jgi:hypothetical protein